jgi:sulfur carrier protein
MMQITVNGKPREIAGECNLLELLHQHAVNPALVAVEYNGDIVRQERFPHVVLHEGDVVEVVHMVGGGGG